MERTDADAVRARLMETSDEFRRIAAEHASYDRRIDELTSRPFPSQEEQLEEAKLKKLKLQLKDQMQNMVRDAQEAVAS